MRPVSVSEGMVLSRKIVKFDPVILPHSAVISNCQLCLKPRIGMYPKCIQLELPSSGGSYIEEQADDVEIHDLFFNACVHTQSVCKCICIAEVSGIPSGGTGGTTLEFVD